VAGSGSAIGGWGWGEGEGSRAGGGGGRGGAGAAGGAADFGQVRKAAAGNPPLYLGTVRKLHHVWAATSEGAGPPRSLGDAKSAPFPREKAAADGRRGGEVR
jgi:hypothetical protein